MTLARKRDKLYMTLQELGSVMVAYSGGTDSAYLAWAAYQVLGTKMLAVIADSPSLPRRELKSASEFAEEHHIPLHVLQTEEMENPDYRRNDSQRCFHCKDELFSRMEQERNKRGFEYLAYGMNLDDRGDFRPGQNAAEQHHAQAPLVTAQLGKQEIRQLAKEANLYVWDKPASACLSSRIEYGRPVTRESLSQVEQAEQALFALGFRQVRVRHHGELARIEIARSEMEGALQLSMLDRISAALRPLGFVYVTLDIQGYRSGSMNDVLPVKAIVPAS
jgi:uncharacterized protein